MSARLAIVVALLGFSLVSYAPPALAQGGKTSCSVGCEQRCQATRLSKGECMNRCTSACEARRKKK